MLNDNKLKQSKERTINLFFCSFQDPGAADQQGGEEFYEATSKTVGR